LMVAAVFAEGQTVIKGASELRVKETDRIHAMATELRKLGAAVEEGKESLTIHPPSEWKSAAIKTYNDHRMAMSFSMCVVAAGKFSCSTLSSASVASSVTSGKPTPPPVPLRRCS